MLDPNGFRQPYIPVCRRAAGDAERLEDGSILSKCDACRQAGRDSSYLVGPVGSPTAQESPSWHAGVALQQASFMESEECICVLLGHLSTACAVGGFVVVMHGPGQTGPINYSVRIQTIATIGWSSGRPYMYAPCMPLKH